MPRSGPPNILWIGTDEHHRDYFADDYYHAVLTEKGWREQ